MGLKQRGDIVVEEENGSFSVQKFGSNPAVGSAAFEDIWLIGGTYTGWLTSAVAVRIAAGGNAADDSSGNGARTVIVEGLDEDFNLASATLTTNGASASTASSQTFIRVFRAYVGDVGTYSAANTGAITIETTGSASLAQIAATRGQTEITMYTVPSGYTAKLERVILEVESSNSAEIRMFQRRNADQTTAPYQGRRLVFRTQDFSGFSSATLNGIEFPAKTDIWFDAKRISGGGDALINIFYEMSLVKKVV